MTLTLTIILFQVFGIQISEGLVAIVLSVIAIWVSIKYGRPALLTWRNEKDKIELRKKSMFKHSGWIDTKRLSYSILDYNREMNLERNPSYQKGVPEMIRRILDIRKENEEQNHILLVGPSLSGKTHITISLLRSLPDAYVLVPDDVTFVHASEEDYELPTAPIDAQYKIILLDNFHEFFKGSPVTPRALIHKAIESGCSIWANCISDEEYSRVNSALGFKDGPIGIFQEVNLDKRMSFTEAENIAKDVGVAKLRSSFNGLIGEIFYPPNAKRLQYEQLKSDPVSFEVLILIKQAYMLGAFTLPHLMKFELIKKAFAQKYSTDYVSLMSALKEIEQKGFIKALFDHKHISFEPVWLNEIVEPNMKPKDFLEFWKEIIPRNVMQFSYLINIAKSYSEAMTFLDEMRDSGISPNIYTYNILIHVSPDYKTALEWYGKIGRGKANEATYSSLIKLSPDYETALGWFHRIEEGKADEIAYCSLISKSLEIDTAMFWLRKMEEEKLPIDEYVYGALIKVASKSRKPKKYQLAIALHDEMLKKGISSNVIIFTHLISLAPDFEQAFKLLELMITLKDKKGKRVLPDAHTKKTILYKTFHDKNLKSKIENWFKEFECKK